MWSHSWFTGLLGTVIGEGIIGFGGGAVISLALTAVIYPIRLFCSLIRRAGEAISRWSRASNRNHQLEQQIEVARPLKSQQLNQEALREALDSGIELRQKPAENYLQTKEFKRYATGQSYLKVFRFIGRPDATAPPLESMDDVEQQQVAASSVNTNLYQGNVADQNPYLAPPFYAY